MKKLIIIGTLLITTSLYATPFTLTQGVLGGTLTNVIFQPQNPVTVSQIIVTAPTATNTAITLWDMPTNSYTYYLGTYTNVTYYATNLVYGPYTNYYTVTYYLTNLALLHATNTSTTTNYSYNARFTGTATSGSSSVYVGSYGFQYGIWATNPTVGAASVTIVGSY